MTPKFRPSSIALATMLSFGLARAHAAEPSMQERPASAKPLESRQQNIGPITCAIPKPTPKPSDTSSGPSRKGFVWGNLGGHLREKPSSDAKPVGNVIPGVRLAYTDVVYDKSGKVRWYYVPGKKYGNPKEGWISVDDVSVERPQAPPGEVEWYEDHAGRIRSKIIIKDSGLGEVKVTATMTCSARGSRRILQAGL
jgi:hypothetical protein